jgi:hypothetical protein
VRVVDCALPSQSDERLLMALESEIEIRYHEKSGEEREVEDEVGAAADVQGSRNAARELGEDGENDSYRGQCYNAEQLESRKALRPNVQGDHNETRYDYRRHYVRTTKFLNSQ